MAANSQSAESGLPETFEEFLKPRCRSCGDRVSQRFFDYGAGECVGCAHQEGQR
jgi:hypothetical protein